ncbi:MAG: Vps62-related protein [Bdellovibrionota bacterium]
MSKRIVLLAFFFILLFAAKKILHRNGFVPQAEGRPSGRKLAQSEFSSYLEPLLKPELVWKTRGSLKGGILGKPMRLIASRKRYRERLDEIVRSYAPRIWWHSADPFGPMDPLKFVQKSSLWKRGAPAKQLTAQGELKPEALKGAHSDSFLRFEDPTYGTGQMRNWAVEALDKEDYSGSFEPGTVPIFWKVSASPVIRNHPVRQAFVFIEYWYHVAYSHATRFGVGNHQGDWEGMSVLVELRLSERKEIQHQAIAAFLASHEGGQWHCARELGWVDRHPEVYTALGTHATYAKSGHFRTSVLEDQTNRGRHWDSWHWLAPLHLEPYFGYRGRWGEEQVVGFMSGPFVPEDETKTIPKQVRGREEALVAEIEKRCSL